jgi:hypothetical protein
MRILFIKMFACAVVASVAFLACNEAKINSSGDDNTPANQVAKSTGYSPPTLVADDVKMWMEGQLASKSNEKRLIRISEMYMPDIDLGMAFSGTASSDGGAKYFVNGKEVDAEEYARLWQEYLQQIKADKRDLSIPGEIVSENSLSWTTLITAEELSDLSKKYGNLSIRFYIEPQDE